MKSCNERPCSGRLQDHIKVSSVFGCDVFCFDCVLCQLTAWWRRCAAAGWSGCPKPGRETCQTNSASARREGESEAGVKLERLVQRLTFVRTHRNEKKCEDMM